MRSDRPRATRARGTRHGRHLAGRAGGDARRELPLPLRFSRRTGPLTVNERSTVPTALDSGPHPASNASARIAAVASAIRSASSVICRRWHRAQSSYHIYTRGGEGKFRDHTAAVRDAGGFLLKIDQDVDEALLRVLLEVSPSNT